MPSIRRRTLLSVIATGSLAAVGGCTSGCPDAGTPEPDDVVRTDTVVSSFDHDPETDWPAPRYDAGNTGYARATTPPPSPLGIRWQTSGPGGSTPASSPIVANGRVLVSGERSVSALRFHDGARAWRTTAVRPTSIERSAGTGGEVVPPVAGQDESVYVGGQDKLVAFGIVNGNERWRYTEGTAFGTPVVARGTVYVGNEESVIAVDAADGSEQWTTPITADIGPLAVAEETVVVPAKAGVFAFDAATGRNRWQVQVTTDSYPVIERGTLYLGTDTGLRALGLATVGSDVRPHPEPDWTFDTGTAAFSAPVITPETIYAVERPDRTEYDDPDEAATFALERTGQRPEPRWCSAVDGATVTAAAGGQVVGCQCSREHTSQSNRLLGFSEQFGDTLWEYPAPAELRSPAVVDRAIIVVDRTGTVTAVGEV